jgi:hypothetical protein
MTSKSNEVSPEVRDAILSVDPGEGDEEPRAEFDLKYDGCEPTEDAPVVTDRHERNQ